jgi:hypothetical protein
MRARHVLPAVAIVVCSGGACADPTSGDPQLRVAGTYPTAVAITSDACGDAVVQPFPTTVVHTAGAASLQLVHAGSTYSGTITQAGSFTTVPSPLVVGDVSYSVAMTGQFTTTGFTSTVTVDRIDPAHPAGCQYVVAWTATRSSGLNVIPGSAGEGD